MSRRQFTAVEQTATRQTLPLVLGIATLALAAGQLWNNDWRHIALWFIGLTLGLALQHASFGFAIAYRRMIVPRDMRGVLAPLLLLGLTTLFFAPVLAGGSVTFQQVGGAWAPLSVSVAVGAFMFGIGKQIAGACGSGTLCSAGWGSGLGFG